MSTSTKPFHEKQTIVGPRHDLRLLVDFAIFFIMKDKLG